MSATSNGTKQSQHMSTKSKNPSAVARNDNCEWKMIFDKRKKRSNQITTINALHCHWMWSVVIPARSHTPCLNHFSTIDYSIFPIRELSILIFSFLPSLARSLLAIHEFRCWLRSRAHTILLITLINSRISNILSVIIQWNTWMNAFSYQFYSFFITHFFSPMHCRWSIHFILFIFTDKWESHRTVFLMHYKRGEYRHGNHRLCQEDELYERVPCEKHNKRTTTERTSASNNKLMLGSMCITEYSILVCPNNAQLLSFIK